MLGPTIINRVIDSLFETRGVENPAIPLTSSNILEYYGVNVKTPSGKQVSPSSAMGYSPVWNAVDLISGDISTLRLNTYQRVGDGKRKAVEHSTFKLLRRFTGELTSNLWIQVMMSNALLFGKGISKIKRDPTGSAVSMEFVPADRVTIYRAPDGQRAYNIKDRDDQVRSYPDANIFHLPGLLLNDLGGLSLINFARNTIGRQLSGEGFTDSFFANGGVPSGWLKYPGRFKSNEEKLEWASNYRKQLVGEGNQFKTPLLDEGIEWVQSGISPKDALLLELLTFGVKDIARFFKIPAHRLSDDAKTSYNSIEQENLAYFTSTLLYWCTRIEFEANRKLLREDEQDTHLVEFLVDTFLRADTLTRAQANNIAILNGSRTRNEVRSSENDNPIDGLDQPLVPMNMQAGDPTPDADNRAVLLATRDLLDAGFRRVARLWIHDAGRAAKKPATFLAWLNDSQVKYRAMWERETHGPARVIQACGGTDADTLAAGCAADLLDAGSRMLLEAAEVTEEHLPDSVALVMDRLTAQCSRAAAGAILSEHQNHED